MNKTKIEWVKNPDGTQGYTWNPITGCLNGCEYCYARKLAHGRLKSRYLANKNIAPYLGERDYERNKKNPFYPRFWEGRLYDGRDELCNAKPKGIFVCDMSDLFGIGIPEEWTRRVIGVIKDRPQHRFYLLTKQPQNLIKWSPFPEKAWSGVTVCDPTMYLNARLALSYTNATVKYLSFEPLLEHIFVSSMGLERAGISWVIIGSQTKPYRPPKIEWVREIVQACDKAGIPVFLKDNLRPLFRDWILPEWARYGHRHNDHPLQLRQELPK